MNKYLHYENVVSFLKEHIKTCLAGQQKWIERLE